MERIPPDAGKVFFKHQFNVKFQECLRIPAFSRLFCLCSLRTKIMNLNAGNDIDRFG